MAFLPPQQRPQAPRQTSFSLPAPPAETTSTPAQAQRKRPLEESQEWILFSPALHDQQSCTTHTSQTPRTAALSRLSDYDSLETGIQSERHRARPDDDNLTCQGTEIEDDDAEEVDSLDDGLHAFHGPISPGLDQSGGSVLPAHDGLGTFPTSYAYATPDGIQEQFWQFERYNPHRRKAQRRRSSVQKRLDAMDEEADMQGFSKQEERRMRVEKWRLEQSRAVLEEIEKETRRRQRRMSMLSGDGSARTGTADDMKASTRPQLTRASTTAASSGSAAAGRDDVPEAETFWQRITRRVIKDLMGLDETTLSVIFGEELPQDATPTRSSPLAESSRACTLAPYRSESWERRLIERISRELDTLVNQLSESERAFSTYNKARNNSPLPSPTGSASQRPSSVAVPTHHQIDSMNHDRSSSGMFQPTLPTNGSAKATDASLWGIEEEATSARLIPQTTTHTDTTAQQTAQDEYWERDLDIGAIFRYLRNRFSSTPQDNPSPDSDDPPEPILPAAWGSSSTNAPTASALGTSPESLRRADLIQRHHPLVSRAASVKRDSAMLRRQHQYLLHRRAASSSCASQSTKRTRSGGSKRYWDFPGGPDSAAGAPGGGGSVVSVGSGALEAMMGSWGEV